MDGRDDRFGTIIEGWKHRAHGSINAFYAGCEFGELLDVGSGDKGSSAPDQDDGFDRRVGATLAQGGFNSLGHARAERIDRRIVDRDNANVAIES
jgi:hypothetical protein